MAPSSNNEPPPACASSTAGPMSDSSSNHATASHASAAGSNNTATSSQPQEQSYQLLAYLAQSPTDDGSPYARLNGGIALPHAGRAEQVITRNDEQFQGGPA
ncbi:hypothetical protein B0I37DRAFT_355096 [Chaetomium sp. MPI-CAGE-AT-0009]|nr:hypothetical protein B0I37DRAFT_355096 [Chaetomium sp. MPI-CAGE-AT-0009]